jgi:hypothetical protein
MAKQQQQGLSGHGVEEVEMEGEKWVDDSSVDHCGRPPLRTATGSWKAAMFIISKLKLPHHLFLIRFAHRCQCVNVSFLAWFQ